MPPRSLYDVLPPRAPFEFPALLLFVLRLWLATAPRDLHIDAALRHTPGHEPHVWIEYVAPGEVVFLRLYEWQPQQPLPQRGDGAVRLPGEKPLLGGRPLQLRDVCSLNLLEQQSER